MYYATKNAVPTAHITKRKSRLKIYNGNQVFLQDGENFEFELYNPKQKSVLVKIKLNGEYISTSGIVLKPGQRVFLERFLDTNNKFQFSTYKVKNTPQNQSAIDLNGDVSIEFYDEKEIVPQINLNGTYWTNGINTINGANSPYWNWNGLTFTTSVNGMNSYSTPTSEFYSSTSPQGPNLRSLTTNIDLSNSKPRMLKKSIETGRVEKGEMSQQTFSNSYQEFSIYVCSNVSYKILPLSTKNTTVEEIRQYCTECGTKVKKNYKFCPSCGNKI